MLIIFVLFFCLLWRPSKCEYDRSNAATGIKLSANDQLLVSGSNAFLNFGVVINPFNSSSTDVFKRCNVRYLSADHFVHSIAVIGAANNGTNRELFMFAFSAEITLTSTPFLCLVTISRSTCTAQYQMTLIHNADKPQNYFLIGVDSHATFVYGFTDTMAFKLEITTNRIVQNRTLESLWPSIIFLPHALDLSDRWGVVVGYGYERNEKKNYAVMECLIDLISLLSYSCQTLIVESTYLVPSNLLSYTELYEVSVAIRGENVLFGIHRLNTIVVLKKTETLLTKTDVHIATSTSLTSFGRSVEWVNEQTLAVVAYHSLHTPWSRSQLFFYEKTSVSSTSPLYTFPNNQQVIGSLLLQPHFVRLVITDKGNVALLTDISHVLIIPVAPAGHVSAWTETSTKSFVFYYSPRPCIGGTFKNRSGLGPCTVCLPGTRNPGIACNTGTSCIPCSHNKSNAYCSLAALVESDLSSMMSYSQVTAYPVSADTTNFDDILLENMFQTDSSDSCWVISPFFWTLVAGALAFSVWIAMTVIKLGRWKKYHRYRTRVKTIFRHTDLIGEGELWVGGLTTIAIAVLVSFAYWFSASFLQRYPIEEVIGPAYFACDPTLINAKFSTGLDLLSIPKSIDAQRIMTLLDNQIFNITVVLINTGFTCDKITVQENLIGTHYTGLIPSCERSESNAITSVTFALPHHYSAVQLNLTGPHWANAIRVCLRGQSQTIMNSMLHTLDFCQLFAAPNQTLAHASVIPIILTKIVNMTKSMEKSHPATYTGLWLPSIHSALLFNEAFYAEFGHYLRYTFALTTIRITFDERSFYIKNIQEPIVRTRQTVFQALLFTSLVIELFGFSFLLVKLFVLPIVRRILAVSRKHRHHDHTDQNHADVQGISSSSRNADIASVYVNVELDKWPTVECPPLNQFQSNEMNGIEIDCISNEAKRHMYLPNYPCKYLLTRQASEPRLVCLRNSQAH